jgi:hypothetical protein
MEGLSYKEYMLTQEKLKEFLEYDSETGAFIWKITPVKSRIKVGDVAGGLDSYGYVLITLQGKVYKAHRLVWLYVFGAIPLERFIDHMDGNPSNNRLINLREATRSENLMNQNISTKNTSGFKGVHLDKKSGLWHATARLNGKKVYLGRFLTPEEASITYNDFCQLHHGEFYRDTRL